MKKTKLETKSHCGTTRKADRRLKNTKREQKLAMGLMKATIK